MKMSSVNVVNVSPNMKCNETFCLSDAKERAFNKKQFWLLIFIFFMNQHVKELY